MRFKRCRNAGASPDPLPIAPLVHSLESRLLLSLSQYYGIHVVDQSDGQGVPQVDLVMTDGTRYTTDDNGYIAFDRSGYMNTPDVFTVESYGYQLASGTTVTLTPTLDTIGTIELDRTNIAERLYRETGDNLYAATVELGFPSPISHPLSDASVLGQDSEINVVYKNQLYWFWGDTGFDTNDSGVQDGASYRTTGAVSALPSQGGLNPNVGINLNYFTGSNGLPTPMFPASQFPGVDPYWIGAPMVVEGPSGNEEMIAFWSEHSDLATIAQGFAIWDDANNDFDDLASIPLSSPIMPGGEATAAVFGGQNYFVFDNGIADMRVKADYADVTNINDYQTYTPLKAGTIFTSTNAFGGTNITASELNTNGSGTPIWAWQANTTPLSGAEVDGLLGANLITKAEDPYQFYDINNPTQQVAFDSGSIEWNDYVKQWVQVSEQVFGTSIDGEIWLAESPTITGPWTYAEKIQTDTLPNNTYTFYNIVQHADFSENSSPYLYYEGTYTNFLVNGGLTGEYFNNNNLTGYVFEEQDSDVDFAWGSSLPDSRLTSTNYSINWSGQIAMPSAESGNYVFQVTTGGGVLLYVNGQLIINDWNGGSSSYTGTFNASAGSTYNINLQYRNLSGSTGVVLSYAQPTTPTSFSVIPSSALTHLPVEPLNNYNDVLYRVDLTDPRLAALSSGTGLTAQYFSGSDFNTYVTTSSTQAVNYNWGSGSPATGVPGGNFSVRFTGEIDPAYSQTYTFSSTTDGGIRMWINGQLLIDDWTPHASTADRATMAFSANQHYDIRIDYSDGDGKAALQLQWQSSNQAMQVVPVTALYTSPNGLIGAFFNGDNLTTQVLQTVDPDVDYYWFGDSPDLATATTDGIWSAEWDGQVQPDYSGVYTFSTTTDDGARLWVNGQLLINDWNNQSATTESGTITLVAGQRYDIRMEYYNDLFTASAQLLWSNTNETGGVAEIIPTTNLFATIGTLPPWLSAASAPDVTWTESAEALTVYGPATITGDPAAYGDSNVAITVIEGGSLTTSLPPDSAIHVGSLNLSGGGSLSLGQSSGAILLTSGLSIDSTSKLDLGNGYLDVVNGNLATVTSLIARGYDGGVWNGMGITSSSAAADSRHLTSLGVISNDIAGAPLYSTFDGAAVSLSDVLVRYTYVGDANLDGKVDASDYSLIDSATLSHLAGTWFNGDFNYDGVINGSDYTLIDNAFNLQGAAFAPAAEVAAPVARAPAMQVLAAAQAALPTSASDQWPWNKPKKKIFWF